MSEQSLDDQSQSHYEISLTAGQAFVAFVLLLLSIAASFAFGLMIGKGQADERLVVRKEPAVITEASVMAKKSGGKIVELGVTSDDFKPAAKSDVTTTAGATKPEVVAEAPATTIAEASTPAEPTAETKTAPVAAAPTNVQHAATAPAPAPHVTAATPNAQQHPASASPAPVQHPAAPSPTLAPSGPAYAQLLSTADQKIAETLAAKLIDHGFTSAYVEHGTSEKGTIFRVRVKFRSDAEARAAEPRLREYSKDVWITSK